MYCRVHSKFVIVTRCIESRREQWSDIYVDRVVLPWYTKETLNFDENRNLQNESRPKQSTSLLIESRKKLAIKEKELISVIS